MPEADRPGRLRVFLESVWMDVLNDRKMTHRWPEVLADRDDLNLRGAKVFESLNNLGSLFAQADHQAGLGDEVRIELSNGTEHIETALVATLRADSQGESIDCLDIMVKDIGLFLYYDVDQIRPPREVRRENLHACRWHQLMKVTYRSGKMPRALIRQIIPSHRRYHDMAQSHGTSGLCDAFRLVQIGGIRLTDLDGAETTVSRANVP